MKNWKIILQNNKSYTIEGSLKDVFALCKKHKTLPRYIASSNVK